MMHASETSITRRQFAVSAGAVLGSCCLGAFQRTAHGNQKPDNEDWPAKVDDYVQHAMAEWKVPGLALAVIKDNKLFYAKGYGVRELGKPQSVDEHTLFPIASCTKSFSAALIGKLVDEGRLKWDSPLGPLVPELGFPARSERPVTIRHALQHRSGYPTANMLWRRGDFSAEEILSRIRLLKPIADPSDHFMYNNVMYLAVGRAAEHIAKGTWHELMRTKLLEPLGMTRTLTSSTQLAQQNNVAAAHATDGERVVAIERYCPDVIAPTGAIHSTVIDMAKWLILHLQDGQLEGQLLLTSDSLREMHTPAQTASPKHDTTTPGAPISRYGLGWFTNEHAGETVVEHSGVQTGFVAWMAMIPTRRLGVVILTNHHQTGINSALRSWVFDRLLDRPDHDWSKSVLTDYTTGWQRLLREAKANFDAAPPKQPATSRPVADYSGTYESPIYGAVRIRADKDRLKLQFGTRFQGELHSWGEDAFRVFFTNPRFHDWLAKFSATDGRVSKIEIQESPWAPDWYDDRDHLGEFVRMQ